MKFLTYLLELICKIWTWRTSPEVKKQQNENAIAKNNADGVNRILDDKL